MKPGKLLFALAVLLYIIPGCVKSQSLTAKTFFSSDTIPALYLGIDFTLAKLVGDEGSNAKVLQIVQYNAINELLVKESKKYDIQGAYYRRNWKYDLTEVEARNDKANPDSLKSTSELMLTRLTNTDIVNLVKNFNFGDHKGYGVLLVMEGMNKLEKKASVWFTLIDMNTKTVLKAERVYGKLGSGFGFRNYWASAIKNAIDEFKKNTYGRWEVM